MGTPQVRGRGSKIPLWRPTGSGRGVSRKKSRFQVGYIGPELSGEEVEAHGERSRRRTDRCGTEGIVG